jgi:ADP-ribosylglycohydrolase
MRRRLFLFNLIASPLSFQSLSALAAQTTTREDRAAGLLWGTLIGDAMGGPLEFAKPEKRTGHVVDCRKWPESKRLDDKTIASIAKRATMMGYEDVRPEPAPYGPWVSKAPAGTVTDDSRFKVILVRAIRQAAKQGTDSVTRTHLANAILEFSPRLDQPADDATQKLMDEGLREYHYAANWVLGKRDPKIALPLDRLWAGIPNCSGQMLLLPLAVKYPGRAEEAYRHSFELNFVDAAGAKDIASAIVAGMASVLGEDADSLTTKERWARLETTMRSVDPFRLKAVPFAGRPLHKWLDLVDSIVERAAGRPSVAYRLLETEGKPVYYWDAHFTLVVALTLLKLSEFNALCALHLAIDFGHDTDSYAQLIGAMAGAVDGAEIFPKAMGQTVARRLKADYGEDVSDWVKLLCPASRGTQ